MPLTSRPPLDCAYARVQPVLKHLASAFRHRHRLPDFWEVFSDACEVFVRKYSAFDPRHSDLLRWSKWVVWKGLLDVHRKRIRRNRLLRRAGGEEEQEALAGLEARPEPGKFSAKRFSLACRPGRRVDVRRVLDALFHEGFLQLDSPRACRTALATHLRTAAGWTRQRVRDTFSEIQEALDA